MRDFIKSFSNRSFKEVVTTRFHLQRPIYRPQEGSYDCMFYYSYMPDFYHERCMNWWIFIKVPKFIGQIFDKSKKI